MGHYFNRPGQASQRFLPRPGEDEGRLLPVLLRQRGEDAARSAGLPSQQERRPFGRARQPRLDRPRGSQQIPRAGDRRRHEPPGAGHVRQDERGGRARGHHRDPRPQRHPGHAAGKAHRGRAVGHARPHPRPAAGQALQVHPAVQEPRRAGRRVAGARPLATDRPAHFAQAGDRGAGRRQAVLHL